MQRSPESFELEFCIACEHEITNRLLFPKSFVRVSCIGPDTEVATPRTYLEHNREEAWADVKDSVRHIIADRNLYISKIRLEFTEEEAVGRFSRKVAICTIAHGMHDGLPVLGRSLQPNVDGWSGYGWATNVYMPQLETKLKSIGE